MELNASYLWAKLSVQEGKWLPLAVHMRDSATVASYLWDRWLSESTKRLIDRSLNDSGSSADPLNFIMFLAASHDLGKASPGFQVKASDQSPQILERIKKSGFSVKSGIDPSKMPHATISMAIMERNGLDRSVAVIAGGHHGAPPSKDDIRPARMTAYSNNTGFKDQTWVDVQNGLLNLAFEISGLDRGSIEGLSLPVNVQDVLTGIVIIADWLASNEQFFPLIDYDKAEIEDPLSRSNYGCTRIDFPHHTGLVYGSEMSFEDAFGFEPRSFQQMAIDTVSKMKEPGLVVVEAPMGEGKTEAALAIAEMLASRFGQNGLFFGLPTQATANSVFVRVKAWAGKCSGEGVRSISLAHGKSAFNDEYTSIPRTGWDVDDNEGNLVVHQWFHGKTGMLSDIVVGTVDQVLMAGLKRKHLYLRHLGLAEKVVIIDECHAYDEYMGSYLSRALSWLGALKVPVVVMSATLPPKRREEMMCAYAGRRLDPRIAEEESYPMVTCVTGDGTFRGTSDASGRGRTVSIRRLRMEDVVAEVGRRLSDGGYAGIIVNTVGHAQSLYGSLKTAYSDDEIVILHSAYTASDRSEREKKLIETMKRGGDRAGRRVIVVGTQVLEQSLDIDFDVMFSEICPVDLLLQRMGRLHRHSNNKRPAGLESPICCIIDSGEEGFDKGTESVYGRYQLMNTRILLGDSVNIPQDVPDLVRSAYSEGGVDVPENLREAYASAKKEKDDMMAKKERKAKVFQISLPEKTKDLVGWLDNERSDPQGLYAEATVRDTDGSVEVILVCRREDGSFHILGDEEGGILDAEHVPEPRVARRLSDCRISFPHRLIANYGVDKLIDAVRVSCKGTVPKVWEDSEWLSGELIQVIDEEGRFSLMGMKFRYDRERGLMADDRYGVQSVGREMDPGRR